MNEQVQDKQTNNTDVVVIRATEEAEKAKESEEAAKMEVEKAQASVGKVTEEIKKAEEDEEKARKQVEEAKERIKRGAEEAKKAADIQAKAIKAAEKAIRERTKREVEESKVRAKLEAEKAQQQKRKEAEKIAVESINTKLYNGTVKLVITTPVNYEQIRRLEESLVRVSDLKLILVGGSDKEGVYMFVSAEQPKPLLSILSNLDMVGAVSQEDGGIDITLRTS